ncbi:MAG TPA: hypothetical protein VFP89_08540 [Propionibacteriaceae bacterium]|nr:hypothetical protein [Propionibacteriaceae bacterium]
MAIVALITWLVTAAFGSYMVAIWASKGGTRSGAGQAGTNLPPSRVFAHLLIAVVGLIVWIIYLVSDSTLWGWIAFVGLLIVASIGGVMVSRWASDRRGAGAGGAVSGGPALAEQHIPAAVVGLHGVFAVGTVVLVLLTVLQVAG